jgi:probable phosphoglycerate mutase
VKAVLHFDGGCRAYGRGGPVGFAAILSMNGDEVTVGERLPTGTTHNMAEYNGLLAGLEHALELGVTELAVYGDSRIVVEQTAGRWKAKSENLRELHARAQELAGRFDRITFEWVPRECNTEADRLVNVVLDRNEAPAVLTDDASLDRGTTDVASDQPL